jgi:hypothetical protein
VDYRLREQGLRTAVEILLTGSIALGQELLVDYEFDPEGRSDILTKGFDVRADLGFYDRFAIYGRYNLIDRNLLEGSVRSLRVSPRDRRTLFGAKFTWPWFSAMAEVEDLNSEFGPFESFEGSVSLFNNQREGWNSRFTSSYRIQEFTDTDREIRRFLAACRGSRRVFQRGLLELQADYLREHWDGPLDEGANDVDAFRFNGDYTWWYGRSQVKLEGRYARILKKAQDENYYLIRLRMRREF